MAHEQFRDQLTLLAGSTAGDPAGYLEGLSPIHADWHLESPRTYGFLLFHYRVARYFRAIVGPVLDQPIVAFTLDEFEAMGVRRFDPDLSNVDELGELVTFSRSIESWHNTAHGAIEQATGTPMMDARQNIFFRPFWQLHYFIDDRFMEVLERYGNRAHPGQFVTNTAIAAHIEARHHGWVPRI